MDTGRLVAMASDIAAFFDSEADKAVAAEGVRFHIMRFWDPRVCAARSSRMRRTAVWALPRRRSPRLRC